ncbi:dolichyl-phosphate beta-glucosyltransferase Alg5 [Schizosaccharomyces octosporus yFS286]|uniref:dolichyl-phosphate beta-glucosyltransferase n=1 Tax=Schizosaccharomyces octosporus (strain yFS286) TaxID=483514 RepID=S9PQ59_SCHOY|nr:dolichyl-phosphate beta-glucosyltransferase Alg5 [Schizosaccharomyces octosporus yFS286]EPX71371.1 dolichyl-phosphate beta-glucosyltransferase Alg5 [Schizosaccharomyces octosporus yFS286]
MLSIEILKSFFRKDPTNMFVSIALSSFLLVLFFGIFFYTYLIRSHCPRKQIEGENRCVYIVDGRKEYKTLKRNVDDQQIRLTVVIPAYNESDRIVDMLKETVDHLEKYYRTFGNRGKRLWEVLVIDDESTDSTVDSVLRFSGSLDLGDHVRVCSLKKNRGKGGAVTWGMLHARGQYAIFADADGASKFSDIELLFESMPKNAIGGVVIGSRAHMVNTEAVVKRSFIRNFLMHSFHKLLQILGVREIGDTQCGFKLFSRFAYQNIFSRMHVEGWIFDIEVLTLARFLQLPIYEIPITWHEVGGSKMTLLKDSIRMAIDLLVIRLNYSFGIWQRPKPKYA